MFTTRNINYLLPDLRQVAKFGLAQFPLSFPNDSKPFITCTFRDGEAQNHLLAVSNMPGSIVTTNASAGNSPHNYVPALAFDIGFIGLDKQLDWSVDLFVKFHHVLLLQFKNIKWGGYFSNFPDYAHFEIKDWQHVVKLHKLEPTNIFNLNNQKTWEQQ